MFDNDILTSEIDDNLYVVTGGTNIRCGKVLQITTINHKDDQDNIVFEKTYLFLMPSNFIEEVKIKSIDNGSTYSYVDDQRTIYSTLNLAVQNSLDSNCI